MLASGLVRELVQGSLPAEASLRDLGEHRLKDLSRPEHVYQILGPGLLTDFPPLRSIEALPNNLPLQSTTFVGRESEVAEITALIEQHRLVTLVGSGGVGKTRTSLHVAANLLDGSADGVWFIELAPLSSGETHDRLMKLLAERLAPDDLARGLAEGAALTLEAAVTLALR